MLTKETCADEAVDVVDLLPSRQRNTVNQEISNRKNAITGLKKIMSVIHYMMPSHWLDGLLNDFEVDFIEFKHVNTNSK